jgi:hypothetical protein
MESGSVPWRDFFELGAGESDATLEFVPAAICSPADFDLQAFLAQAVSELAAIRKMLV